MIFADTSIIDDVVAFRMDGAGIKRIRSVSNPEETRRLLEGLGAEATDFFQLPPGCERTVLVAIANDVLSELRAEPRDIREQLFAGGVHFDADVVDATDDDVVKPLLEPGLIHGVLVLADAD